MEMRTGVGGHWINQTSFNFSDYKEYGPKNIKDIFFPTHIGKKMFYYYYYY
ncbi:hypothetical protein [Ornithobacterium rhinotracheale]|uniref:hypothetical protein n=1 Tax=Ornithobacterium rhinotracheale TaxID=28251 RepID=UPI001FB8D6C8|nr:hypothetical protein [Ornithobacterium rhinotracheale]MCK0193519.1 hypothetical protein [Ornithobacterium rhinotracheale]UOH66415.1 hypothetical protein MT999_03150 [Ornithobacterium rhinotracheale]